MDHARAPVEDFILDTLRAELRRWKTRHVLQQSLLRIRVGPDRELEISKEIGACAREISRIEKLIGSRRNALGLGVCR